MHGNLSKGIVLLATKGNCVSSIVQSQDKLPQLRILQLIINHPTVETACRRQRRKDLFSPHSSSQAVSVKRGPAITMQWGYWTVKYKIPMYTLQLALCSLRRREKPKLGKGVVTLCVCLCVLWGERERRGEKRFININFFTINSTCLDRSFKGFWGCSKQSCLLST